MMLPSAKNHNKKQWWHRCVVRRTASIIEGDLEAVIAKSPFLQQTPRKGNSLAYFQRSEIKTRRLLGRGAFSEVYEVIGVELDEAISTIVSQETQSTRQTIANEAVDPKTGEGRYVIKHLQAHLLERKEEYTVAAANMAIEAAYLSRIDHPHISTLRGLPVTGLSALEDGQHDGYFLILDRLVDTLDQRILDWQSQEQRKESPRSSLRLLAHSKIEYARQLASAIDYLHQRRIIFRDLKPQNVGFNRDGLIQLFDFGLCRDLPETLGADMDEEVFEMSGVGTRRYQAPETIRGCCYNVKADVYSWSMVVYQMFTLQKPFAEYSMHQHAVFVCRDGGRPSGDQMATIPPVLRSLLAKSWCQSISERYTMSEVLFQLEELLEAKDKAPFFLSLQQKLLGIVEPLLSKDDTSSNKTRVPNNFYTAFKSTLSIRKLPTLLQSSSSGFSAEEDYSSDTGDKRHDQSTESPRRCPAA